jgi:hypothetical protein
LLSPTDPAARYTAAANTPAVYAYSDNYLIEERSVRFRETRLGKQAGRAHARFFLRSIHG